MCEYENRLIAWIDNELEADASRELEHHLEMCPGCSGKIREYREVSRAFAAYHASPHAKKSRLALPWAAAGAIGTAAIAAAILWMLRVPVEHLPLPAPKIAKPPAIAFETGWHAPLGTVRPRAVAQRHAIPRQPAWPGMEPFVEIAIPGDAIFAPGALPPGMSFAADLSIASDGSPRVLRVQPGVYLK